MAVLAFLQLPYETCVHIVDFGRPRNLHGIIHESFMTTNNIFGQRRCLDMWHINMNHHALNTNDFNYIFPGAAEPGGGAICPFRSSKDSVKAISDVIEPPYFQKFSFGS
jgi:hypothetical protein